ncbi:MAG: GGDEF domain-containing protein [Bacilli bacterium]|nr:GGDEF domain-containing protein [Bacilli bacterium]
MARSTIKEYFLYGGVTKEEYDSIRPLIQEENHRVWRLVSILFEFVFIGLFIFAVVAEINYTWTIGYGILAGSMVFSVLAFFVLLKPQSKALLPFIYVSLAILLGACIYIGVFAEPHRPSIVVPAIIIGVTFLTLDRPIRFIIMQIVTLAAFITLVCIFKQNQPEGTTMIGGINSVLLTDVMCSGVFTAAGVLISLFLSSIRMRDLVMRKNAEQERDRDALTNVANKLAYDRKVDYINGKLGDSNFKFAVAIFDVNGLKQTNDTYGHDQGDKLLVRCCELIQSSFPNTPIYRIGGDEFAAIILGEDYTNREKLIREFHERIEHSHEEAESLLEDTSIAIGVAIYNPKRDRDYLSVFSRADAEMYDNKRVTKARNAFLQENQ